MKMGHSDMKTGQLDMESGQLIFLKGIVEDFEEI